MGGTFNPIHFGHIRPTIEAGKKLKLDKIFFIPAYSPPHKSNETIVSAQHRIEMIHLVIEEYPNFELSTIEIDRKGTSYFIDTITTLMKKKKSYDDFFILMGIDAFQEIDTWKDANHLLRSCNFVIVARIGFMFPDLSEVIKKNLSEKFRDLQFRYGKIEPESGSTCIEVNSSPYLIIPFAAKPVNISSTIIREKIKCGKSIKGLVPGKINNYIEKNRLYR